MRYAASGPALDNTQLHMRMDYPDKIEIQPLKTTPNAKVHVPGSKSITNRALVLAALSEPNRGSELRGVLQSEDTEVMVAALRDLGFHVHADWHRGTLHVHRGDLHVFGGPATPVIPVSQADLFVANSGTTMRFLTAMVSL